MKIVVAGGFRPPATSLTGYAGKTRRQSPIWAHWDGVQRSDGVADIAQRCPRRRARRPAAESCTSPKACVHLWQFNLTLGHRRVVRVVLCPPLLPTHACGFNPAARTECRALPPPRHQRDAGPTYEDKDFDTNFTNERELRKARSNLFTWVGRAVPCPPRLPTHACGFNPTARTE